jgi:hypothetical protein
MAIISANNQIRSISLFHLTLAGILIKNPSMISNQGVVLLLGESMQLVHLPSHSFPLFLPTANTTQPTPRDFSKPSALSAFLAIIFAFLGISDLTSLSLPAEISDEHWGLQAPVRLLFLFLVTAYTYIFKEGGMLAPRGVDWRMSANVGISNSIVFTWGFFEVAAWFWVYTTLREERMEKAKIAVEKQKREADRL